MNDKRHVFRDHERWALLVAGFVAARWEPGAFVDIITPGGSFALGYELPHRLRIAVGGRLERALDGSENKLHHEKHEAHEEGLKR